MLFSKAINGLFLFSMNISINHIIKNVKSFTFCNENKDHLRKMCKLRTCKHNEIGECPFQNCGGTIWIYRDIPNHNRRLSLIPLQQVSLFQLQNVLSIERNFRELRFFLLFFLTNNHSYLCKCLFTDITVLTVSYSSQLSFCWS